jgi:hypothetical protein
VSASKDKNKKWLHALSVEPIVHMSKEDLLAEPTGTTDCPYVEVGVPVRSHNSNQPQVKRLKVENLMGKLE